MKTLLTFLIFLTSCAHAKDSYPNHAKLNFNRVEFIVSADRKSKRELGFASMLVKNDSDLSKFSVKIYPILTGKIIVKSPLCNIDKTYRFVNSYPITINMKDLIRRPRRCIINFTSVTDKIGNKEHLIMETGVLFTYLQDMDIKSPLITYDGKIWTGQGAVQRSEGVLSATELVYIQVDSKFGKYRISGCGKNLEGEYVSSIFPLSIKDLYDKTELGLKDTCMFNMSILPYDEDVTYRGSLFYNIYDSKVVKVSNPFYHFSFGFLRVNADEEVIACIINGRYKKGSRCGAKYRYGTEYWIRVVTSNGRKNVMMIKNGEIVWSE